MTDFDLSSGTLEYLFQGERKKKRLRIGEDIQWDHGAVSWREDRTLGGMRIRVYCDPGENVELVSASLEYGCSYGDRDRIFCNGFQTWTTSREYSVEERIPGLSFPGRWYGLDRYGDYHFISKFRKKAPLYSHSWTYIRHDTGLDFIGSLAEKEGYTLFLHDPAAERGFVVRDCEGVLRPHGYLLFDLFYTRGHENDVFTSYFTLLGLPGERKSISGWTSWYNYYTNITEEVIIENIEAFSEKDVPADVFQIDDGYQTSVGDWLSVKASFPRGMKYLADRIRRAGYRPGIWLAPFVCCKNSRLRAEHPEWILSDFHGRQVCAGRNPGWDGPFYALDIYHEGFREYLRGVFDTVVSTWGYEVLKLDFLYAAGLIPRLGKSRGEVMAEGAKFLAELAGGADILGCGVPLSSCMGVFPYCRIGSDAAPRWEDSLLRMIRYRERVSTINSLTSTIGRRQLSGRAFLNDPDVFILRDEVKMSREQRKTLFLLNVILGDVLFTSDNISRYPPDTMNLFLSLFPLPDRRITGVREGDGIVRIEFEINGAVYRSFTNLGNDMEYRDLSDGAWVIQPTAWDTGTPKPVDLIELAAHETVYLQKLDDGYPVLAGGTGHLFPAALVESLALEGDDLTVVFDPDAPQSVRVYILLPSPGRYRVNGRWRESKGTGDGPGLIVCGA